ncbi:MAG: primosomal replication protein N [Pseudomonadota bacterium]
MDNRLIIVGILGNTPETRYSPAGIPITRFTLRHESTQQEAGMQRQAICNIGVIASGSELMEASRSLQSGQQLRVSGFLSRANNRQGENRLILHAEQIESL